MPIIYVIQQSKLTSTTDFLTITIEDELWEGFAAHGCIPYMMYYKNKTRMSNNNFVIDILVYHDNINLY